MDVASQTIFRRVIRKELKKWIQILKLLDNRLGIWILEKIIWISLVYQFDDVGDLDNFIRRLKELRLNIKRALWRAFNEISLF